MLNGQKVIVVMPAYNAARTLAKTVSEIPRDIVDEILLVDDASSDETVELANKLDLTVFLHEKNFGYGRNQKTCYREALRRGADIVVTVETYVFSLPQNKLVWSGTSETTNPKNAEKLTLQLAQESARELQRLGLIAN